MEDERPACQHGEARVRITAIFERTTPHEITLSVTFDAATPTAEVLERVQHALDVHARPEAVQALRRSKALLN